MSKNRFNASLSKGRSGWCVIFQHPKVCDQQGKPKRIRRGLGTRSDDEASHLVSQLNEILADQTMWSPTAEEKAAAKYDRIIVAAFYDSIKPDKRDGRQEREKIIPIPIDDGYSVAQFVGATGSGKTTIVRQLLGTDPKNERFPSTSASKTTVADLEAIFSEGDFQAVISFMSRNNAGFYIGECVKAAANEYLNGSTEEKIIQCLMQSNDMRFRLNYILGSLDVPKLDDSPELSDENEEEEDVTQGETEITDTDKERFQQKLQSYLKRVKELAKKIKDEIVDKIVADNNINEENATPSDRNALLELVEEEFSVREEYHVILDDILDEILSRFDNLPYGTIKKDRDEWPKIWEYKTDNREIFLKAVNRFSSNYAPDFGKLLTPLVEGIRVSGPFKPEWDSSEELPRLVLLDGQGIGHTADSVSSVSTNITDRFPLADTIILVDNAAQPMQAASLAVMKTVLTSGHGSKLAICFTHCDSVSGDNLQDSKAKKNHIKSSLDNAIKIISQSLEPGAERTISHNLNERLFYLSNIQKTLPEKSRYTRDEFSKLIKIFKKSIPPQKPASYHPVYDVANLVLAVQKATQEFHERWKGILDLGNRSSVGKAHWAKIKALTLRIAYYKVNEYDSLRPVADLIQYLQTHLSIFLANPVEWKSKGTSQADGQEKKDIILDEIKKSVFQKLHVLTEQRLVEGQLNRWGKAYQYRGNGSTFDRAQEVDGIYESAAPVPKEMPGPDKEFLLDLRKIVREAIDEMGGQVLEW